MVGVDRVIIRTRENMTGNRSAMVLRKGRMVRAFATGVALGAVMLASAPAMANSAAVAVTHHGVREGKQNASRAAVTKAL